MKERLREMLKGTDIKINKLKMGTFHSICVRILRQYGHLIGLKAFKIAADRDWDDVMKSIIDPLHDEISNVRDLVAAGRLAAGKYINLHGKSGSKAPYDLKRIKKQISSLKSKGIYPRDYSQQSDHNRELQAIYRVFQAKLEEKGLLDFDDLLAKTNELLSVRHCLGNIQHVLIDEFQDTNTVQLELMCKFAKGSPDNKDNVTVVGDPDQGIYRFRDAVSLNFDLMRQRYPQCQIIKLGENYRSTTDVLNFSEALMSQQRSRVSKSLVSQYPHSFPPVYRVLPSREEEADAIADEIWHLKSLPGLFRYSDFAILVRSAHLSRAVEQALVKKSIPYVIVKGRAFWERKEVEIIVDFLRLAAHEDDPVALLRLLQMFTTGIGPVTVKKIGRIVDHQRTKGLSSLETFAQLSTGDLKGLTPKIREQIGGYLQLVQKAKSFVAGDKHDVESLTELFDFITSQGPLASLIKDDKEREGNVKEVKTQLLEFEPVKEELMNSEDSEPVEIVEETFLENFVSSIQLYLTENKIDEENGSVCISTIHSSKGLEWPVVFIPGLCEGSIPSSHVGKDENAGEALDEERRVLYVSTTRAKQLLYLSTPISSGYNQGGTSRFLTKAVLDMTLSEQKALSSKDQVKSLYNAIGAFYDDSVHGTTVTNVLNSYEKLRLDRAKKQAALESSYLAGCFESYANAAFFTGALMYKEPRLPGPGDKKYAPSSNPQNDINLNVASSIPHIRPATFQNLNRRFASTDRPIVKRETPSQTSFSVPNIENSVAFPKMGVFRVNNSQESGPPVEKKRKTLGVRRRMP